MLAKICLTSTSVGTLYQPLQLQCHTQQPTQSVFHMNRARTSVGAKHDRIRWLKTETFSGHASPLT
jgi:hypothetical protein